jgi:hypothetical protein
LLVKAQSEREKAIERFEAALKTSARRREARSVAGAPPRLLDAHIVGEMADIAKIPDTGFELLCFSVFSFVDTALGVAYRHKIWQASDVESSAKQIEAAARELEAAIKKASEGAREAVRLSLPSPRVPSLAEYTKIASELAAAAKSVSRPKQPWIDFRRDLISKFLSNVDRAGGRLTVSGEEGTLFEVFECLKPCLPKRFQISRPTLRIIWRSWRRGLKHPKPDTK